MSSIPASLRALLSDLIDYAGLFPPAGLDMKTAVENYASYLAGPDAWALARFVLPVSRFAEFEAAIASVQPIEPWGISALLGSSPAFDLAEIDKFNQRNKGRAAVDAVEVKAETADEISHIRAYVRGSITCYFEIPPVKSAELLPTISAVHARAKVRTGGVTQDAFPPSETVARFIVECAKHNVAFKATAGLHHPVRCVKPLTYEANAPTGTMHGFLNVFLAAIAAKNWVEKPVRNREWWISAMIDNMAPQLEFTNELAAITAEGEPVQLGTAGGGWMARFHSGGQAGARLSVRMIRNVRQNFAISFGSCSFEEPLSDLRDLNLL